MFDSLVPHKQQIKKANAIPLHHHGMVFVIVVTVLTTSMVTTGFILGVRPETDVIHAAVGKQMTVWLSGSTEREEFVAPVTLLPIATLTARMGEQPIALRSVSFLLDGTFDPGAISGITFFADNVQVGYPALPDENGQVQFSFESLVFKKGEHTLQARLTAPTLLDGSVFRVEFTPLTAFTITDLTGRPANVLMLYPFTSNLFVSLPYGHIGAFVRSSGSSSGAPRFTSMLYVYVEGEDMRLDSISIESEHDITGARIDVFDGDVFVASGFFDGTKASVPFDDSVQRLLRIKNKGYRLLLADIPESLLRDPGKLFLSAVTAEGYLSQHQVTLKSHLELF